MRLKLAFDLDGTLISAKEKQTAALRACLIRYGLNADTEAYWFLKREGANNFDALRTLGLDTRQARDVATAWAGIVEMPIFCAFDRLSTSTTTKLDTLIKSGADLYLVTARRDPISLKQQLQGLGLSKRFTEMISVDPDRAVLSKSEALLRINPIVFVGDSEVDSQASKLAKIPFIPISSGQRSTSFFAKNGITDSFEDIGSALDNLISKLV